MAASHQVLDAIESNTDIARAGARHASRTSAIEQLSGLADAVLHSEAQWESFYDAFLHLTPTDRSAIRAGFQW